MFAAAIAWSMSAVPAVAGELTQGDGFLKEHASLEAVRQDLKLAACTHHWDRAVELMGVLMASPDISSEQRADLVRERHELQGALHRHEAIAVAPQQCEGLLASYLPVAAVVSPPLNWESALYSGPEATEFNPLPDQVARQQAAAQQARLTQVMETEIPPLSPARLVSTHTGSGVSAGVVSTGVDVFSFVAGGGDRISLAVTVTDVHPGRLYTDEDSQLFLFDQNGTLLADNDDLSRLQSQITDFSLPRTGRYYVAVTTYNNDPILDSTRRITGWNGNGGSAIEYTLTMTGLTPAGQLVLPTTLQPEQ